MTGDDFASQWEQVVIQLRGQLGESTYQNWLRFVSCDGLEGGSVLLDRIGQLCRPALGWDDGRWEKEKKDYLETWQKYYGPPKY